MRSSSHYRHRLLLSGCLALSLMTGCFNPSASPAGTGKRGPNGNAGRSGASVGADGLSTGDTAAIAGVAPGPALAPNVGTAQGNAATSNTVGPALAAATSTPIDTSKFIVGRVLVPPGIVSNNGANVIGQNGANIISNNGGNVVGQNGANIVSNNGGNVIGQNGANVIGQNGANVIGQNGANVIGQNGANVIGQNGANVIGQNGANVIGQNGANVIGQNGANVNGQNGANIISNNGGSFSLGQRPLAYASIKVVDASGKVRTGPNGAELVGQADAQGNFLLPRDAVSANSVIVVSSPAITGEMVAFVPSSGAPNVLDVDIASTLTTRYILNEYVVQEQVVLDRLTSEIEIEARQDVTNAIDRQSERLPRNLDTHALKSSLESLIDDISDVGDVFDRIERLLVIVGIVNDGEGLPGTEVPLDGINGLVATEAGQFLFVASTHLALFIDKGGVVRSVAPSSAWPYTPKKEPLLDHSGMAFRSGWLYLCDTNNHRVVRVRNGHVEVLAGTGEIGWSTDGAIAKEARISYPTGLALSHDGTLYFSDSNNQVVRRITQEGKLETVVGGGPTTNATTEIPAREVKLAQPRGLAFDSSGNLIIADYLNSKIRKFLVATGKVLDIPTNKEVIGPQAVTTNTDSIIATTDSGNGLIQLKNGINTSINPPRVADSSIFSWTSLKPKALSTRDGLLYVQDNDNRLIEAKLDGIGTSRALAGVSPRNNTDLTGNGSASEQLQYGSSMAENNNGDIVISDNFRIYIKKYGQPLTLLAGGQYGGFTKSANDARIVKIPAVGSVEWDGTDAVIFCGYSMSFGDTDTVYPAVQRVTVNSQLETIAGNGGSSNNAPIGLAIETSIHAPRATIRLEGGNLLIYDRDGRIDEVSPSGQINTYTKWPTNESPHKPSLSGKDILYLESNQGSIKLFNGAKSIELADFSKITNLITGIKSFSEITDVAMDLDKRLFIATENEVIQFNINSGRFRTLAGRDGIILNGTSADQSLDDITDIDISKDGGLLILEYKQINQIPRSILTTLP